MNLYMSDLLITWPPLTIGTLVRRYKRFMVDVQLDSGEVITAHCPNSGSMRGCLEQNAQVFLTTSSNPKRKFSKTWEFIEMPSSIVVINTLMANRIVKKAVRSGFIPELASYDNIRAEVPYGNNSRIDLLLEGHSRKPCYVEIKSCTLVEDGIAMFPDSITTRGHKHLIELEGEIKSGNRCVMFFLVQRMDSYVFRPAEHIDPTYAEELRVAHSCGVEILVYTTDINLDGVSLGRKIPFDLS
jgi:sugar fermentation stimulation protein A